MLSDLRIFDADGLEIAIPPGGDGDIGCSLEPIDGAADIRRDVNGGLIVVRNPLFRKYSVSIDGRGSAAPGFGGMWIGETITVHTVAQLTHTVRAGTATLARDPVPGSVDARTQDGTAVPAAVSGRVVSAPGAAVVHYRPIITGVLTAREIDADELAGTASWSLTVEES